MIKGFGDISLRRINHRDIKSLQDWRNDEAIYKWCRQNDLISDFDQQAWFDKQNTDPTTKMYAVDFDKYTVGVCGLTSIDYINRRAEFSLYISPSQQNEGYGKLALMTLLKHGFDSLNLNSIWGECFQGNHAALMFEKLGMVKEGTRRQFYYKNGCYINADLYSILLVEYRAQKWKN